MSEIKMPGLGDRAFFFDFIDPALILACDLLHVSEHGKYLAQDHTVLDDDRIHRVIFRL